MPGCRRPRKGAYVLGDWSLTCVLQIANPEDQPYLAVSVTSDYDGDEKNHMVVVTAPGHYFRAVGFDLEKEGYKWSAYKENDDVFIKTIDLDDNITPGTDVADLEMQSITKQLAPYAEFFNVRRG